MGSINSIYIPWLWSWWFWLHI